MRKFPIHIWALTGLALVSGAAQADAAAGAATATGVCATCHGAKGISAADTFPNLAGQKKSYLVGALKAYRDKTRNNPMMNGMAAPLNDQQIEDLAAYYASQKPCE
ncbi:c-type cytochrome [Candidatus Methylocalor cossyra]|uniref:Cytochrome c553 n=1 Tax=Candidatus Methylocalor cossyra TaxID=3108543 RepID=A0ABM9NLI0_9GAMM